ncbi:MAG TPA: hypothetical protein VHC69_00250 [Polyangiaceae bacterium]|nr:hypothetical protein [Polyangiaceae bacterium]
MSYRRPLASTLAFVCIALPATVRAEETTTWPPGLEPVPPPSIPPPPPFDAKAAAATGETRSSRVSSLEITATIGPSVVFGDAANPEYSPSLRRVGVFGELGVAYRSRYFIDPFLAVSYAQLASGQAEMPNGPWGAGGMLDQRLDAWLVAPGITADLWRIRLRAALGFAIVVERYRYPGEDHSTTQVPLAHQLGLGFNVLDVRRFRLDLEARYVGAPGADITFLTFAAVMRGDLIEFGKR